MPEGEVFKSVEDMKKETMDIMHRLVEIESTLARMQVRLEKGDVVSYDEMVDTIKSIRDEIGSLEREDQKLIGEEEQADTLLSRLKTWVDEVI